MRLVLIEWEDAYGCPRGWEYASDVEPNMAIIHSVGWLLKETKKYKFLVPHLNKAGTSECPQIAGYITIPVGAVRRQTTLVAKSSSSVLRRTRRAVLA